MVVGGVSESTVGVVLVGFLPADFGGEVLAGFLPLDFGGKGDSLITSKSASEKYRGIPPLPN